MTNFEKKIYNDAILILSSSSKGEDRIETTKRLISILIGLHNIEAIDDETFKEIDDEFISVMKIAGIEGENLLYLEDIFKTVINKPDAEIFDEHLGELSEAGSCAYDLLYDAFALLLDIDKVCDTINFIIKYE